MSRAFVKESDGDGDDVGALPELPVSEHPNYVTPRGLSLLRMRLDETRRRLVAIDPAAERAPAERAFFEREQRWLQARAMAAITVSAPANVDRVGFGATVELIDTDGTAHRYRIVGEDEANPEHNLVSWVSPLARALDGARVGDSVTWRRPVGDREVDVVAIRYEADRT